MFDGFSLSVFLGDFSKLAKSPTAESCARQRSGSGKRSPAMCRIQ
jgi:hypothetical protein